jgi:hypothetical protein
MSCSASQPVLSSFKVILSKRRPLYLHKPDAVPTHKNPLLSRVMACTLLEGSPLAEVYVLKTGHPNLSEAVLAMEVENKKRYRNSLCKKTWYKRR